MINKDFSLPESRSELEELIYIRKILFVLWLQVLGSCAFAALFCIIPSLSDYLGSKILLVFIVKIGLIITITILFKVEWISNNFFLSVLCLILIILEIGSILGIIFSYLGLKNILLILWFYLSIHTVAFLHAAIERENYSKEIGFAGIIGISVVNISMIFYIVPAFVDSELIWEGFIPVFFGIYGGFLIYHTSKISHGKHKELNRERLILGAISVYADLALILPNMVKKQWQNRNAENKRSSLNNYH